MKKGSSSSSSSSSSLFSLSCICRDSKSASVSDVSSATSRRRPRKRLSETRTLDSTTTPTSSTSYPCYSFDEEVITVTNSPPSPPATFSDLLRQLGELEQSLAEWGRPQEWSRVEDSVAVVRETADPFGDFRRSMLHMIVENEIVGGEELRELLRRFLVLNNPLYHDLILRAFADIWADVFDGLERTPDILRRRRVGKRTVR